MTNNVWLRFITELVALVSFIASMTENNFSEKCTAPAL